MMKKTILIAALAMGAVTTSNAQDITFGAKAGAQIVNFVGDDIEGQEARISGYGGVFANMELTDDIHIQPELLFSMQGSKAKDFDVTFKYNYLNIPVMFQYKLTDQIYGELGPQLGILLSAEIENNEAELTTDVKDDSKTVDFGLNFGVGYTMENGLGINARYGLGLTTVDDSENESDVKNAVISFGLSYQL